MNQRAMLLAVAALVVMGASAAGAQTAVSRDSAGIRIVDVPSALLSAIPWWTIEGPTVRIGDAGGDPNYEFNRAGAAWRKRPGGDSIPRDEPGSADGPHGELK